MYDYVVVTTDKKFDVYSLSECGKEVVLKPTAPNSITICSICDDLWDKSAMLNSICPECVF